MQAKNSHFRYFTMGLSGSRFRPNRENQKTGRAKWCIVSAQLLGHINEERDRLPK